MQPYDVANKEMELESIITDTRLSKKKKITDTLHEFD